MKAQELITRLIAAGAILARTEKVNTMNAWGFDGWYGERHHFTDPAGNAFTFERGTVGTRHQGTYPRALVYVVGVRKPFVPKLFIRLYETGGLEEAKKYAYENA